MINGAVIVAGQVADSLAFMRLQRNLERLEADMQELVFVIDELQRFCVRQIHTVQPADQLFMAGP